MSTMIIATDLSDQSLHATRWAASFLDLLLENGEPVDEVIIAHVISPETLAARQVIDHEPDNSFDDARSQVQRWLNSVELPRTPRIEVRPGSPARAIPDLVNEEQARWLILGQTGKGRLAKFFLGTTAERIALNPPCVTVLVKDQSFPWEGPIHLLAAIDSQDSSLEAAAIAARHFAPRQAHVTLVEVINLPKMGSGLIDAPTLPTAIARQLETAEQEAREAIQIRWSKLTADREISTAVELRPGYPAQELLFLIHELTPDLLTLGVNEHSRFSRFFLGSVGHGIVRQAPTTIMLHPITTDER